MKDNSNSQEDNRENAEGEHSAHSGWHWSPGWQSLLLELGLLKLLDLLADALLLFVGDVHYAQGDGEVSGTAIEMGSVTTLRVVKIHPGKAKDLSMPATKGND